MKEMAKHMYTQFEHDACGIGTIVNIDGRQDHRVVDGMLAAQFVYEIKRLLEEPTLLLL